MLSNGRVGRRKARIATLLEVGTWLATGLFIGCSSADAPSARPQGQPQGTSSCGNGVIDTGEICDGAMLNGASCSSATMGAFPGGTIACRGDCMGYDMSGCASGPSGGAGAPPNMPPPGGAGAPPMNMPGTGGSISGGGAPPGGAGAPPGGGGVPPGGAGAPPNGGSGAVGAGGTPIVTMGDPTIPPVNGMCPDFTDGANITFMGISGLQIVAGAKPAAATAPMVLYWHGTVSNAGEYAIMAGAVQQGVKAAGGILVSPNGTTGGDLLSGTSIFGAGDLKVMDQLVACAVMNHNVDPKKIYTMGCSAGGLMSTATATERSAYIAAAAPNSGGWTVPVPWQDMHTPALMTVHGAMGSDVVIVDFSQTSATADMGFKTHGSFVIDCNTGGGHCGGGGLAGDVWKFFQAHPFGAKPDPWAGGLPAGFSSQCKIQ